MDFVRAQEKCLEAKKKKKRRLEISQTGSERWCAMEKPSQWAEDIINDNPEEAEIAIQRRLQLIQSEELRLQEHLRCVTATGCLDMSLQDLD